MGAEIFFWLILGKKLVAKDFLFLSASLCVEKAYQCSVTIWQTLCGGALWLVLFSARTKIIFVTCTNYGIWRKICHVEKFQICSIWQMWRNLKFLHTCLVFDVENVFTKCAIYNVMYSNQVKSVWSWFTKNSTKNVWGKNIFKVCACIILLVLCGWAIITWLLQAFSSLSWTSLMMIMIVNRGSFVVPTRALYVAMHHTATFCFLTQTSALQCSWSPNST